MHTFRVSRRVFNKHVFKSVGILSILHKFVLRTWLELSLRYVLCYCNGIRRHICDAGPETSSNVVIVIWHECMSLIKSIRFKAFTFILIKYHEPMISYVKILVYWPIRVAVMRPQGQPPCHGLININSHHSVLY